MTARTLAAAQSKMQQLQLRADHRDTLIIMYALQYG
jgi:hypothetical protein